MEKFVQIPVGSDSLLVRVSDIAKIVPDSVAPTTETEIHYVDGTSVALTHTAATGFAQVVALWVLVEKALSTDWQKPVYEASASDLDKPVSAIA